MMVRVSRAVWLTASILFCVGILLWQLLLRTPLRNDYWQLELSEVFAVWFYLPLVPLVVGALLLRSRMALVALLPPLILFASQYGTQLLPNWQLALADLDEAPRLRVFTWNMLYTNELEGEFYTHIQRLAPDVIALQEVDYNVEKEMVALFGDRYPYYRIQNAGSSSGIAIWSRLPMIDSAQSTARLLGCICIRVTLDLEGRPITVITAHSWSPRIYYGYRRSLIPRVTYFSTADQDLVIRALINQVEESARPLLLLGDLNTTEQQANFSALRAQGLQDAHEAAGWGMGFTFPNPDSRYGRRRIYPSIIRIDHILFSPEWTALATWADSIPVSDHLYVVADLALTE